MSHGQICLGEFTSLGYRLGPVLALYSPINRGVLLSTLELWDVLYIAKTITNIIRKIITRNTTISSIFKVFFCLFLMKLRFNSIHLR